MTLHSLSPTVSYVHKMDHRNGSPNKSQWCITEDQERMCFFDNYLEGCVGPIDISWGILIINNQVEQLGTSQARFSPVKEIFLAKFIDSNSTGTWHGYPVDHTKSIHDIPSEKALNYWLEAGYISTAKMRKIAGGQKWKP